MQTGLALANAKLTTVIAEEVARREKMNRELEIAREVQERLFPQRHPAVAGIDYCGKCRTALGVGGDYYDFLALPAGRLGVALGDVSGKGISAALLMASLEASLRAEAARAGGDVGQMIGRVNQLIYDASAEDRYATLFYAEYDPAQHLLTYVNAGHNAPILLREGCACAERLDEGGGPVVGLIPECPYRQAAISLNPGDMLVIYSDGISEAMSPELEEWGEERLISAARESTGSCSAEVVAQIMEAAAAHAAGAPQSDDMTLVVVRAVKD
jgi:sigma-B regulation protein RsbU (phosphoserine phosphatase)